MIDVRDVVVIVAGIVTVSALVTHQDGLSIGLFFGLLGGLGLGRMQPNGRSTTTTA